MDWRDELNLAGPVTATAVDVTPAAPPLDRERHAFGSGPFARLRMPPLPNAPGLYVWSSNGSPLYVGQTSGTLRSRLGSNGYATISTYNTLARQPGRTNGGQQTNCRVNALANLVLRGGGDLEIWTRMTLKEEANAAEAMFMRLHGLPPWNRQDRRR